MTFSILPRWLRGYIWHVAVGLSITLNALLGGRLMETTCLRAALKRDAGSRFGCIFCKIVDWFDPYHCTASVLWYRRHAGWRTA